MSAKLGRPCYATNVISIRKKATYYDSVIAKVHIISSLLALVLIATKMDASSFPKLQIGILLGMQTVEPIAATVIFPFVVQLVNELGVTHGNPKLTGYYVGLIVRI